MTMKAPTGNESIREFETGADLFKMPAVPVTYTASTTASLLDVGKLVRMNSASANNYTIAADSASLTFRDNTVLTIKQDGAGLTTLVAGGGVTINFVSGAGLNSAGQYAIFGVIKDSANVWTAFGNTAS